MNLIKRFFNAIPVLGMVNIPVEEMKKRYGTDNDKYLDFDGIQIRYRDEGKGPALILLHGVCAFLDTWDGWARILKKNFRVIRLDIPGFGITGPAPDKSYYVRDNLIKIMDRIITEIGLKSFYIAGNSLGGYIAWNYALDYPKKVKKLILVDPVGYHQKLPFLLSFASNPFISLYARFMMPRFMMYKAVSQVYGVKSRVTRERQQQYFEFAMREGNKGSYVDIFKEIKKQNNFPDLSKNIPNINVPVLVMWGQKDEWIPYKYFDNWKRDIPSAKFISYVDAGHVSMEEIPEKSAADALDFLNEKPRGKKARR
jgi:pimeloyl-ACP methyl ester carboxylesterase